MRILKPFLVVLCEFSFKKKIKLVNNLLYKYVSHQHFMMRDVLLHEHNFLRNLFSGLFINDVGTLLGS